MISKRMLVLILRGGVPSLLVAGAVAGQGSVSVQIWMAGAAVWVVGTLLWDFVVAAGVGRDRRSAAVRISKWRHQRRTSHGRGKVRTLSLLLANAQTNSRLHANSLRPRLVALAEHFVPIRHGFDIDHNPARTAALLGDVAWLIDPAVMDRAPTSAEIGRFLQIILADQDEPMSTHRTDSQVVST